MRGFAASVAFVLAHEGGFQNRRDDRGNWTSGIIGQGELKGTNFGISAMTYPTIDIANLTVEQAKEIYRRDFWEPVKGDDLPSAIALGLFDFGINAGKGTAIKLLQTTLGVTADGVLGPKTIAAANAADPIKIALRFAEGRIMHYAALSNWATWKTHWTRRTLEVLAEAVKLG